MEFILEVLLTVTRFNNKYDVLLIRLVGFLKLIDLALLLRALLLQLSHLLLRFDEFCFAIDHVLRLLEKGLVLFARLVKSYSSPEPSHVRCCSSVYCFFPPSNCLSASWFLNSKS